MVIWLNAHILCLEITYSDQYEMTSNFTILGHKIEHVKSFKYLGIVLSGDMSKTSEIDCAHNAFPGEFYGVYSES